MSACGHTSVDEDAVRLALAAGASVWETFRQHGVI